MQKVQQMLLTGPGPGPALIASARVKLSRSVQVAAQCITAAYRAREATGCTTSGTAYQISATKFHRTTSWGIDQMDSRALVGGFDLLPQRGEQRQLPEEQSHGMKAADCLDYLSLLYCPMLYEDP